MHTPVEPSLVAMVSKNAFGKGSCRPLPLGACDVYDVDAVELIESYSHLTQTPRHQLKVVTLFLVLLPLSLNLGSV